MNFSILLPDRIFASFADFAEVLSKYILFQEISAPVNRVSVFQSTYPSPENRREKIKEAIVKYANLKK